MDTPMARWLAWNIRAQMHAIILYATAMSAAQPSSINAEETRILNCPIYEIFIENVGPDHN